MITQTELQDTLSYEPDSGEFRWKVAKGSRANVGDVAANRDILGYVRIGINGRRYYAHQLAWLYMNGVWPEGEIDHKNCKKDDNAIENLRVPPSRSFHNGNRGSQHKGLKGTSWNKQRQKWEAYISKDYKRSFLGYFDSEIEAHRAYCNAAVNLFGAFARFE